MKIRPRIIVDSREAVHAPEIVRKLRRLGAITVVQYLTAGDYVLSNDLAVERKTVHDFATTLSKRDLFEQVQVLREVYPKAVLVLEGDLDDLVYRRKIRIEPILGALAALARCGVAVIPTRNKDDTAKVLYYMAKQEQAQSRNNLPEVKVVKKARSVREFQLILLSSLPGIGKEKANLILKSYNTPLNALINFRNWKNKVRGIGEETIRKIEKVLLTPYDESASTIFNVVGDKNSYSLNGFKKNEVHKKSE